MTFAETMAALESMGTAQNRKVYARHGAGDGCLGVSFANIYKLQKQIKMDHKLACQLWETGIFDARSLAVLIADPMAMSAKDLDSWAKSTYVRGVCDIFVRHVAAKSPHAAKCGAAWRKSKDEYVSQAGWEVLGAEAMSQNALPDGYFEEHLRIIEKNIHSAPNWTRYAMNGALIAIGIRNPALRKLALAASKRIGKVEVDHGETNCKTPDAAAYIAKAIARKKK